MSAQKGTGLTLVGAVGKKTDYKLRSALVTIGSDPNNEIVIEEPSTFSDNFASEAGDGGGISNLGTLTVTNSTFSSNGVSNLNGGGGAIFNFGTLTVTNSTFFHNSARFGGAIDKAGTLFVTDSTFSGNAISSPAPGSGAGIANFSKASVESTILALASRNGTLAAVIAFNFSR